MSLAPSPTTTIDGVEVFANPSKSGQPRNAWLGIDIFDRGGKRYGLEMFGGATRAAVARQCTGGLSRLLIVEAAKHEWHPTPQRKLPF